MITSETGRKKVIVVTDGDRVAKAAVEAAARNVGARTISASAGNPTPISGEAISQLIRQAQGDLVLVMVDDKGHSREGRGEKAMAGLFRDDGIDILGVIAVASNTEGLDATTVDFSVSRRHAVVPGAVDKEGNPLGAQTGIIGDTLTVLDGIDAPMVVGLGDPGKMEEADSIEKGAPVLTQAIREILRRSGMGQDMVKT